MRLWLPSSVRGQPEALVLAAFIPRQKDRSDKPAVSLKAVGCSDKECSLSEPEICKSATCEFWTSFSRLRRAGPAKVCHCKLCQLTARFLELIHAVEGFVNAHFSGSSSRAIGSHCRI